MSTKKTKNVVEKTPCQIYSRSIGTFRKRILRLQKECIDNVGYFNDIIDNIDSPSLQELNIDKINDSIRELQKVVYLLKDQSKIALDNVDKLDSNVNDNLRDIKIASERKKK